MRFTCQPDREARRNQCHHQIAGSHTFRNKWLHVGTTQHPFDMLGMTFADLRIAQNQRVAQQLVQRDALVGQQRMPRRHRHHQRIAPYRYGGDAIAYVIGLCEPHIV